MQITIKSDSFGEKLEKQIGVDVLPCKGDSIRINGDTYCVTNIIHEVECSRVTSVTVTVYNEALLSEALLKTGNRNG